MAEIKSPLRVLQVVTNMDRGGLETMLMNYYRHVDRSAVQFDFLTHRAEKAAFDDEILSLGGKIYHLPRLVPWSRSYRAALDGFFSEHPEYRIVHVHQDCLSSVILETAKKHNIPVRIAHSHSSNQDHDIKYPIKRFYMHLIPSYSTDLFACSKAAGNWMFRGSAFQVLANAIDARSFSFSLEERIELREQLHISPDTLLIGHVGRFERPKNHSFLIDIFRAVVDVHPDSKLLLVGNGGRMDEIREKAEKLGLSERVIFTGVRSDIPDLLQAMDIFVLPSRYEGLGIVAVEAQAAGLPCVVSDQVPDECMVTNGLVTKMDLSDSPAQWATHILSRRDTPRTNRYEEVKASGYDIVSSARKLQQFYLEKVCHV